MSPLQPNRPYWILFLAVLTNKLGTMVGPFLPLYLSDVWRLDEQATTRLIAAVSACSLLGGPLGGWLADRLGRRWTLIGALALNGLVLIALPSSPALAVLVGLLLAYRLTSDAVRPAISAAVADVVPPESRARAFGLLRIAINIGFGAGTFLGGLLSRVSFGLLFLIDGGTALVAAALLLTLFPETRRAAPPDDTASPPPPAEPPLPGATGRFALLCACGLLVSLVSMQLTSTLPLSLRRRGGEETASLYGTLLALNALVVVIGQVPITAWIERRRPGRVLAAGALCYGFGYGAVALSVAPLPLGAAVVLLTLGEVLFYPLAATVTAELAPAHARGRWFGVLQAAYGIGSVLSPLLGGWILGRFGDATLWACSPPLGLLAALGLLLLRVPPRTPTEP